MVINLVKIQKILTKLNLVLYTEYYASSQEAKENNWFFGIPTKIGIKRKSSYGR